MKKKIGKMQEELTMRKKIYFMFALLLGAGVAFLSCSKEDSQIENIDTTEKNQYHVSIPAEKKSTKAVADGGTATFKTTENVYICNTSKGNYVDWGVLHPNANGAKATFVGTLEGSYSVGNSLKVLYNTTLEGIADYTTQNGTIERVTDAGVGTVSVADIEPNGNLITTTADIENLQSIFKFTFKNKSTGNTINVKHVKITSVGNKLQQSYDVVNDTPVYGPVEITNSTALSTVYMALRFTPTSGDPITFRVIDENGIFYQATKNAPAAGFAIGKFYNSTITVEEDIPFYYYGTTNCLLFPPGTSAQTLYLQSYKTDHTFERTHWSAPEAPQPVRAEIIWEETQGLITLSYFNIPSNPSASRSVNVNHDPSKYGNALVGIYDASDNLLWSYHIWCPEDNPTTFDYTVTLSGDTYQVMNMSIGATKYATIASSEEDKVKAFGLCYQWGRKDPLGRPNAIAASNVIKPVYDKDGNTITLTSAAYIKDIDDVLAGYTDEATDGPKSHLWQDMLLLIQVSSLKFSTKCILITGQQKLTTTSGVIHIQVAPIQL